MKTIVLLILIALVFCLNAIALKYFFPMAATDWGVWVKYFTAKDGINDAMYFALALVLVWNVKHILARAISVFFLIVTGGSFLDKVIFGINRFVFSDIGLIIGGLIVSIYLYLRWRKMSKTG